MELVGEASGRASGALFRGSVEEALAQVAGIRARIAAREPVGGGDINRAVRLRLADGSTWFLKENTGKPDDFFLAEAAGLAAIRRTRTIRVPEVLACGKAGDTLFLLMEDLSGGRRARGAWERLGQRLAAMHRAETAALLPLGMSYGFSLDGYIGHTRQKNPPRASWVAFFHEARLGFQMKRAWHVFDAPLRRQASWLLDHLDRYLSEPAAPSLVHGDLWGGNVMTRPDGELALIDPAAYVGDRESDLAMTELFGGFPEAFYRAYEEAAPLAAGYEERRALYQLYHLLNHLNMFGGGYLAAVARILRRYAPRG